MPGMMLDGVKIIDFTTTVAGPLCSQFLSQLGAEVIKIESPVKMDDARYYPPYKGSFSISFAQTNIGKRCVTIDLKRPEGLALFKEMTKACDVFLENYTPGTVKRLGIDYDALKDLNPRLIMCSISAYGQTGPLSSLPGYDGTIQAMTGLMSVTGYPELPPLRTGSVLVDINTAFFGGLSICAALYARQISGMGTHLDIAMYDVGICMLESKSIDYANTGNIPTRTGNRHPGISPFDTYRTKDSYVVIICAGDGPFRDLCNGMGMPNLPADERFKDIFTRNAHEPELKRIIEDWSTQYTTAEVVEKLIAAGAPVAAVHDIKQAIDHPHTRARGMLIDVEQPGVGNMVLVSMPGKATNYQVGKFGHTHSPGEDNIWLLKEVLGKSEAEIQKISESKVMG